MKTLDSSNVPSLGNELSIVASPSTFQTTTRSRRSLRRLCSFLRSRSDGGALVEFALVAPLMLAMITAMFSFGFVLTIYFQLTNAVDSSARTLAVRRATNTDGTTPDPCATAVTAFTSAAPNLAVSSASFSFVLNGVSYPNVKTCSAGSANVLSGTNAQVTATYPYTIMLFGWKPLALTLNAQTTELVQ